MYLHPNKGISLNNKHFSECTKYYQHIKQNYSFECFGRMSALLLGRSWGEGKPMKIKFVYS